MAAIFARIPRFTVGMIDDQQEVPILKLSLPLKSGDVTNE
jgi:hypothetical protein